MNQNRGHMKFIVIGIIAVFIIFFMYNNAKNKKLAAENNAIGEQFLLANKAKDNIQTTASGLQYEVLNQGDGTRHPSATDTVKVHYHGTLLDGVVFDSSVDRGTPISFPLNRVIKGWTEGVQLMKVGDKYRFFIPANLAYGNSATGSITPCSTLIFEVELLDIE